MKNNLDDGPKGLGNPKGPGGPKGSRGPKGRGDQRGHWSVVEGTGTEEQRDWGDQRVRGTKGAWGTKGVGGNKWARGTKGTGETKGAEGHGKNNKLLWHWAENDGIFLEKINILMARPITIMESRSY